MRPSGVHFKNCVISSRMPSTLSGVGQYAVRLSLLSPRPCLSSVSLRCHDVVNIRPAFQLGRPPTSLPRIPSWPPRASANATGASHAPCRSPSLTVIGLLPLGVFAHAVGCTPCLPAHKLAKTVPRTGHHRLAPSIASLRLAAPNPFLMSQAVNTFVGSAAFSHGSSTLFLELLPRGILPSWCAPAAL